jgi:hypothetical protein
MSLIKDPQNKAHKLNYLFSYLIILITLGHIFFFLQLLPLITQIDLTKNTPLTPPLTKENPIKMHDVKTPRN